MANNTQKELRRDRIRRRIRSTIRGTAKRPRLCIHKSNKHIKAQLIDDLAAHTMVSASTDTSSLKSELEGKAKKEQAEIVGKHLAKLADEQGISKAVFDRSGYKYHGVVKALADGAREGGLDF